MEWPRKYKETYTRLGLSSPRGILLYGPPGCSKTTLAKAVAQHIGAGFFTMHGASIYSAYVGESERTRILAFLWIDAWLSARRVYVC